MQDSGSRISEIAPEDLTAEQAAVLEAVQRGRGFLPTPFRIWLHSPKLAEHMEGLGTFLSTSSSLTEREYEIAVVVVVRRLGSAFPLDAHVRGALKAGHPPAVVDALREGHDPELATDRERAIYDIARTANDLEPASDEIFDRAVTALGREGLADLLALIGYYTAVGVAMKVHRVPAPAKASG
jgi:4-carboxymuconolactone decarboxylase